MTNQTQNPQFNSVREATARLLATENITVIQDPKAKTAYFDLRSRVLALPVWSGMSNAQYDMLIGHEVGHALYTPNGNGGWVDQAKRIAAENGFPNNPLAERAAQTMLNVVEDARIERLVQQRYPGLRRDFFSAYSDFHTKRDIFGVQGTDLADLVLADRLKLHVKIGNIQPIPFNGADEQAFIARITAAQTWADVVAIAEDLFRFEAEGGVPQVQLTPGQPGDEGDEDGLTVEVDGDQFGSGGSDSGSGDRASDTTDSGKGKGQQSSTDSGEDGESGSDKSKPQSTGSGEAQGSGKGQSQSEADDGKTDAGEAGAQAAKGAGEHNRPVPRGASTTEAFDRKIERSVDTTARSRTYVKIDPALDSGNHILSYKDYLAVMRRWEALPGDQIHRQNFVNLDKAIDAMVTDTKASITAFAREFEMRKTADEHRRTVESKSGRLDMDQAWRYRISDNLFKTATTMRDGKNHGFVMFVDFSGSMQECMEQTLRQLYLLFQFCRKVGVPFDVYGFGAGIVNGKDWPSLRTLHNPYNATPAKDGVTGILKPGGHLLHILSSAMTAAELKDAFRYTLAVGAYGGSYAAPIPVGLGGSTPLDSTIVLAAQIVEEFKARTKVQIVNTVFLTDGDATDRLLYRQGDGWGSGVTVLRDRLKEYITDDVWGSGGTSTLLRWLGDRVGGNILGIFVTNSERMVQHVCGGTDDQRISTKKAFRANGWASTTNAGFTEYFVLRGQVQDTEEAMRHFDSITSGSLTPAALKRSFLKAVEQRNGARGLIRRFVEIVA